MLRLMLAAVVAVVVAGTSGCGGRDDRAVTIETSDGTSALKNDGSESTLRTM
jgi:hypothetical protein